MFPLHHCATSRDWAPLETMRTAYRPLDNTTLPIAISRSLTRISTGSVSCFPKSTTVPVVILKTSRSGAAVRPITARTGKLKWDSRELVIRPEIEESNTTVNEMAAPVGPEMATAIGHRLIDRPMSGRDAEIARTPGLAPRCSAKVAVDRTMASGHPGGPSPDSLAAISANAFQEVSGAPA